MAERDPLVVVVEDDTSVREALLRLLDAGGFATTGHATAEDFLAAGADPRTGCFILDIRMPGMGGLALFQRLRKSHAACPVVFLTGHGDIPMAVKAVQEGAFEFLTKPVDETVLLDAVQQALLEHARRSERQHEAAQARARIAGLTPRELEVLRHVITGALNKQIADVLGIAEPTVKIHRASIRAKLDVHSVVEQLDIARLAGVEPAE